MQMQRHVLAAATAAMAAASCGSEPMTAPSLGDLQGEWRMSWTEFGTGVFCEWADVTLSLRDPRKGLPGLWGGGTGSCAGLVESGNLVLVSFPLDSLTVDNGLIRFVPQGSTYRFQGKVTANEMNGTMSASPYYPDVGVQVQTTGRWQAVREPTP